MASCIYCRPNFTKEQRDVVVALIEERVRQTDLNDPAFDLLYRTLLKVRDAKLFTA